MHLFLHIAWIVIQIIVAIWLFLLVMVNIT